MSQALQLYEPHPEIVYTLETTAELAGVTRRAVLVYWRYGVVRPRFLPPYGAMRFDAAAIHQLRRAEYLRQSLGVSPLAARLILELWSELESTQAQLRELRHW